MYQLATYVEQVEADRVVQQDDTGRSDQLMKQPLKQGNEPITTLRQQLKLSQQTKSHLLLSTSAEGSNVFTLFVCLFFCLFVC